MFNEYPYSNLTDVNLDYILKHIKELATNLQDFIKLNTIKYADPIDWNISKQYEANTVVVNEFTGVAYLSTQPVPAGVDVTNTDYWTPIFTLDFVNMNKNITLRNDGNNNNATFASVTGDWLIVGGQLYKVIQDISVHTAYVVGFNIQVYSVELFVRDYLNQVLTMIGDLDDLDTSDKTSIVNAINIVLSDLIAMKAIVIKKVDTVNDLIDFDCVAGDIVYVSGYYSINDGGGSYYIISNTHNGFYHSLTNGLYANIVIDDEMTPEQFGAHGDGVSDDLISVTNVVKYSKRVVMNKHYHFIAPPIIDGFNVFVSIPSNRYITGVGTVDIAPNSLEQYAIFAVIPDDGVYKTNVTIDGLTIIGDKSTHTGTAGQWGFGVAVFGGDHVHVNNCKISKCWGDAVYIGRYSAETVMPHDIIISNNFLDDNRRNNISVVSGVDIFVHHNTLTNCNGQNPQAGIDVEPDGALDLLENIIIDSNIIKDNHNYGVLLVARSADENFKFKNRNISVINNDISGETCIGVCLQSLADESLGAATGGYEIKGNNIHNCKKGVLNHGFSCVIANNTFKDFGTSTDYVINCDDVLQDDVFIMDNIFDTSNAVNGTIKIHNCQSFINGNSFMYQRSANTIEFDFQSHIVNNMFIRYVANTQLSVIKYTGSDGAMIIKNNCVYNRRTNSPLVFLDSTLASAPTGNACVDGNIHYGVTFSNIANTYGGNNYLNGTLVS